MSLFEVPLPADAILPDNCRDDPAARLFVSRCVARGEPAPAVDDPARAVAGSRLVRLQVGLTPAGWALPVCRRGAVRQVNARAAPGGGPVSWVVDWEGAGDDAAYRAISWSMDWWPRGVSRVSAPSFAQPYATMYGLALEEDAGWLEALLRSWLKRWLAERQRDLDLLDVACPRSADPLVQVSP